MSGRRCGNCGKLGHYRPGCPTKAAPPATPTPPETPSEPAADLEEERIVIALSDDSDRVPNIKTVESLSSGAPEHWNVMTVRGRKRGVDLALAMEATHVFFVENVAAKTLGGLKPHVERLRAVLYDAHIAVVISSEHGGDLDVALKLSGAHQSVNAKAAVKETFTGVVRRGRELRPAKEPCATKPADGDTGKYKTGGGTWLWAIDADGSPDKKAVSK